MLTCEVLFASEAKFARRGSTDVNRASLDRDISNLLDGLPFC